MSLTITRGAPVEADAEICWNLLESQWTRYRYQNRSVHGVASRSLFFLLSSA